MNRQKSIMIVCVVLILGSAAWTYHYYSSQPEPGQTIAFTRPAACAACGEFYISEFGDMPATCKKCGAVALWHAMKCSNPDCAAIVPVIRDDTAKGGTRPCPKCGETRFLEAGIDDFR